YHNLVNGLYPSFRLGWLATFFFAFEILTGVFLMVYYTPSPLAAYENMLNILSNVPLGRLMRDMHKLGGELMVIVVVLHMLRTFITGSYKKPRQFTWATGVILLGVTLFISFFGYLLPWDQLSLWAVTIGASMAEAVPLEVVGRTANLLVRGGPESVPTVCCTPICCTSWPCRSSASSPLAFTTTRSLSTGTACRPRRRRSASTPPSVCRWTTAPTSSPTLPPASCSTSRCWWRCW
ncbi:MAG: cytochrome b N-terminal domain-containing protein, partial [Chloroflexota bacterium]